MVEAIEKYLRPLGVELTRTNLADQYRVGGYFLWIKLPNGVASSEVAEWAKAGENLATSPGITFGVSGGNDRVDFGGFLRLSFSYEEQPSLVEGIVRLARVIRRL